MCEMRYVKQEFLNRLFATDGMGHGHIDLLERGPNMYFFYSCLGIGHIFDLELLGEG